MNDLFRRLAERTSTLAGTPLAFLIAFAVIIVWLLTGPIFDFSDTWQLIINTGTTIITFLMVFLIQNAENRDAKARQIKLDELIRSTLDARNSLINIEHLSDDQLRVLQDSFSRLTQKEGDTAEQLLEQIEEELEERDEEEG